MKYTEAEMNEALGERVDCKARSILADAIAELIAMRKAMREIGSFAIMGQKYTPLVWLEEILGVAEKWAKDA